MSALWGAQTVRKRLLFVSAALVIALAGCQYTGSADGPVQTSSEASTETGTQAAAPSVTSEPTGDPRASGLEDMRDWASKALKPAMPGQKAGAGSSNSTFMQGMSAEPGGYELHFLCEGPSEVELSVATWRGVPVLEPVKVLCDRNVFQAPVQLATEGADFKMDPGPGSEARYAFRLVPSK